MNWLSRYRSLSLPRLWLGDFMHFAVPTVGGTILIRVSDVAAARRSCQPLISWGAILARSIGLTSKKWPQLRQAYMPLPWPHLYEHPHSIANVVIEREWKGERAIFFEWIRQPEQNTLREIDAMLRGMKVAKIEDVGSFRFMIRITRYPLPLRRLLWRIALYCSGRLRMHHFGTFSLNLLAPRHLQTTQSATLHAVSMFFGPVQPDGSMFVQIFFDHRVIDGAAAKRMIGDLETTLNREIVAELRAGGGTLL